MRLGESKASVFKRFAKAPILRRTVRLIGFAALLAGAGVASAKGPLADEPLVEVQSVDPTIMVELRYATPQNVTGRMLYRPEQPCLLRKSVAKKLLVAQAFLKERGFRLKIWDAWRPASAQQMLWELMPDRSFVAPPKGLALHTWGVALDATLVDLKGRPVAMPTDFDVFTEHAAMYYKGPDKKIAYHVSTLQVAMGSAGFLGMKTEWWHFIPRNYLDYQP